MAKKLHNSFIEFLVVIGFDQETGLSISENSEQKPDADLFSINFEPNVLASISSENAVYPQRYMKLNMFYPPPNLRRTLSVDMENSTDGELGHGHIQQRRLTRRATIKPAEKFALPEVLENMPQFCFPDGAFISKKQPEPDLNSFLLTDIEGNKTFGVVLKFYREFYCCLNEGEVSLKYDLIRANDENDETEESKNYLLIYAPTTILLLSKHSYYNVFKDCLASLYASLCKDSNEIQSIVEAFAYKMTNFLVPPPFVQRFGVVLEYALPGKNIQIFPAEEAGFSVFDMNLGVALSKFDVDTLLKIILSILAEQKIVFTSKKSNVLTPIIECFMKVIQPFKWQPTYVPLLPSSKLDFIEAPTPFIMGYHASYKDEIAKSDEIVLIDIDLGTIRIPESLNLVMFPSHHVDYFSHKFKLIDLDVLEMKKLTSLSFLNYDEYIEFEKSVIQNLNSELMDLFLEFYVYVFDDIYSCIKIQNKTFNKKRYLEMQSEAYRPFYEQTINTFIFEFFINERIANYTSQINDSYFKLLEKIKLNSSIQLNSLMSIENSLLYEIKENKASNYIKPIKNILKMPQFEANSEGYHNSCLKLFTEQLKVSSSLIYRDCLHYLRGLLYISMGRLNDGLEDLYAIDSAEIFPKTLLQNSIIPSLTAAQKETLFEHSNFYTMAPTFKKFENGNDVFLQSMSADIEEGFVDFSDLDMNEFCDKLEELDIRIDNETVRRLYNALTIETSKLEIIAFQLFVDYWYMREEELQRINKYLPRNRLKLKEFAVKVANQTVVTDHGIGRIVLTQKSLYHLEQGTNKVMKLVDLKNIKTIEKIQAYSFKRGSEKQALKIVSTEGSFELGLTEERNLWYLLVKEMWSATLILEESKDPLVIQSAVQNVKLLNCVVGCANDSEASHSIDLEAVAPCLCYYTYHLDNEEGRHKENNNQLLHLRINPSGRNFEKNSVESIICVESDDYLTVWCAVGNRIKIFDSTTWTYESSDIKLKDKITCMKCEPIKSKIWVGAIDRSMYIIDIATRSFDRKIDAHSDIVVAIEILSSQNCIFSCTPSGEVIFWDPKGFEIIKTIRLKETLPEFNRLINIIAAPPNKLICTNTDRVLILNAENFQFEHKLILENNEKPLPISCCCVSQTDNQKLIWIACASHGFIWVWDLNDYELKMRFGVDESLGFRTLVYANGMIWAGSKNGKLSVFSVDTFEYEKTLSAHKDSIRCLCLVNKRFVVSGSSSKDGTIAIWKTSNLTKQNQ